MMRYNWLAAKHEGILIKDFLLMSKPGQSKNTASFIPYDFIIIMLLLCTTAAVYLSVRHHDFINFDDPDYVTKNDLVQSGLTLKNISATFQFSQKGDKTYYHPLTEISHMLDYHLFRLSSGRHHLMNLVLHLCNIFLLYICFRLMTGRRLESAFIAALFALHPLNTETVAWISERKNLLSTFFWFLTILSYLFYVKKKNICRYSLLFICMFLGLLAKPVLVTLPCVLLLLDLWPLGRVFFLDIEQKNHIAATEKFIAFFANNSHLLVEKIPLFLLSLLWIYISVLSNHTIGLMISTESVPMNLRITSAFVSYCLYIKKLLWPFGLSIYYSYPTKMLPLWQIVCSILFLLFTSFIIIRKLKPLPWLTVGWLWFLGTLVPVIGLKQNGLWPLIADRWTYIPFIGIYIIIARGGSELIESRKLKKPFHITAASFLLISYLVITSSQLKHWKNSITIYSHALSVSDKFYLIHNNLGAALAEKGELFEAIKQFHAALSLKPDFEETHFNLGLALSEVNRKNEAVDHYNFALRLKPENANAHNNLGVLLFESGNIDEAIFHYKEAIRLHPDFADAYCNLGVSMLKKKAINEAESLLKQALFLKQNHENAHTNLGNLYLTKGETDNAIFHFREALKINPGLYECNYNLGFLFQKKGALQKAIKYYLFALTIKKDFYEAHLQLANIYEQTGEVDTSLGHYTEAAMIKPDNPQLQYKIGSIDVRKGKLEDAIQNFSNALRLNPEFTDARESLTNTTIFLEKIRTIESYFEEQMNQSPANPFLPYQLGKLYQKMNVFGNAIAQYEKALSIKPDYILALNGLATIYIEKKEYDLSISFYKKIINHQPEQKSIYYNIACLYAKQKEIESSLIWLEKAVAKGYDNWEKMTTDKDLEIIRTSPEYKKILDKR